MTNNQFKQTCKQLFNLLTETRQIEIRKKYALQELGFPREKAADFALQTIKKEKDWPEEYQRYANSETEIKIATWHYISVVMEDWQIAHFEIVGFITSWEIKEKPGVIKNIQDDTYHSATERFWQLASEWTNKFVEKYINYDWSIKGDFYEVVEAFCNEENSKTEEHYHV